MVDIKIHLLNLKISVKTALFLGRLKEKLGSKKEAKVKPEK
jgi:hypothetical protein